MRKVMRPRYYCDHCNKGGGSGGHIRKHEERCTKNPARKCGMCGLTESEQPDLKALMALLPTVEEQSYTDYSDDGRHSWVTFRTIPPETVKALREAAGQCPACMMAALRQRGLPVRTAEGFDFEKESKSILSDYNDAQAEREYAYQY